MEHDIENLLRKKVIAAEQDAVTWQKREVWSKINGRLAPAKQRFEWYYAAALVLITCLSVYTMQYVTNLKTDQKIKSLEMTLATKQKVKLPTGNEIVVQECSIDGALPIKRKAKTTLQTLAGSKNIKEADKTSDITTPSAHDEPLLTEVPVEQDVEKHVLKATQQMTNKVEPIIGVFIPEEEPVYVVKEKKIKFRLFRSPDRYPEKNEDNTKVLFARIN
jgi:hypothetical protein